MISTFAPTLVPFLLGVIARKIGWLSARTADEFLKFIFYISAPCLIVPAFSTLPITSSVLVVPLTGVAVVLTTYFAWRTLLLPRLNLPRTTLGVCLTGTLIMNIGFLLPFVFLSLDSEALAYLFLMDSINGIFTFSFVYFLATQHGSHPASLLENVKKIVFSPVNWSILVGLALNLTNSRLPPPVASVMKPLGDSAIPLVMVSLGLYFTVTKDRLHLVALMIGMRSVLGFCLGFACVTLFGIHGDAGQIVLLCCSAPIGINTLTFASLEGLDTELAAKAISLSILLGFLYVPLILQLQF
ncbi:MAG: AEC family transporter [Bdellovibrionales bacterium]|nr:AEC family transporter [Bdellovibrionales bacterium]